MATTPPPPSQVRTGLTIVSAAAAEELAVVAAQTTSAEEMRAALFLAAPIIVSEYSDGTAALALDWYEELREFAAPEEAFAPSPVRLVTDEDVRAAIAAATVALQSTPDDLAPDAITTTLRLVGGRVEELVADAFRDTITVNSNQDPESVGWRRFARPEACKFCVMLAAKGAVYTERTARFAAHGAVMGGNRKGGNCMCIAGPAFGGKEIWAEATPMQYLASRRKRTAKQKAELRDYLNEHFPDAPG